jgi:hypothetical protein
VVSPVAPTVAKLTDVLAPLGVIHALLRRDAGVTNLDDSVFLLAIAHGIFVAANIALPFLSTQRRDRHIPGYTSRSPCL